MVPGAIGKEDQANGCHARGEYVPHFMANFGLQRFHCGYRSGKAPFSVP